MNRVVHCSDLHFGRHFRQSRADRLLEWIENLEADAVVVSGDLTMRAHTGQFEQARGFLMKIRAPLVLNPGNHDIPLFNLVERWLNPFGKFRKYTRDLCKSPVQLGKVAVYALNSVNRWHHQKGHLSDSDLTAYEAWAKKLPPDSWRIAVTHQHFVNPPLHTRPGKIWAPRKVLERLAAAGTHAVLYGHTHKHYIGSTEKHFPGLNPPLVLVNAGTACSGRLRGGQNRCNSFNVLEFEDGVFRAIPFDWNEPADNFLAGEPQVFERSHFASRGAGAAGRG